MSSGQIYAKTPIGDEAVRQSTRVVQRNLRMVLVQIDGKLSVDELAAKIGNARLVENAIEELERGGYIVPLAQQSAAWAMRQLNSATDQLAAVPQSMPFGPATTNESKGDGGQSQVSRFSSFGKPVLPVVDAAPAELPQDSEDEPAAPRPWLKLASWSGLGLLLLSILALVFFPYNNYRPDIERSLSGALQMPVRLESFSLKLLPEPHFALGGVELGDSEESRIESIRIAQPWRLLFSGADGVEEVTVVGASMRVNRLLALPAVGRPGALPWSGVRHVALRDLRVAAGDTLYLGPLQGRLQFSVGQLESATLETPDRSVLISAKPMDSGLDLLLDGRAWQLPGLPATFPSFQAKAMLREGSLELREIDASCLGGLLKGTWTLSWNDRLSMSGSGVMTRLDLRRISADLFSRLSAEGDLGGNIRVSGRGDDWPGLWRSAVAEMTIDVTRGLLTGVDIGEAARRGQGAVVRAGETRFDRLRAVLSVSEQGALMRDINLDAGPLTATGQARISSAGEVNGGLLVLVRSSVSTTRVVQTLSGALPTLTVSAAQ